MERKLIKNATVFDGKSSRLQEHANIVIEGKLVKKSMRERSRKRDLLKSMMQKIIS